MAGASFLSPAEHERFLEEYDAFPRSIRRYDPDGRQADDDGARPLVGVARRELLSLRHRKGTAFSCVAVDVVKDDGMSWAAAAVDGMVRQEGADVDLVRLSGEMAFGRLPEIASVLSLRRFADYARQERLTRSFRSLAPWLRIGLVVLAVAASVAGAVALQLVSSRAGQEPSPTALLQPGPILLMALAAAAGLLGPEAVTRARTKDDAPAIKALAEELETRVGDIAYQTFIDRLAAELARTRLPRFVIVDGYHRLDPTTANVVHRYLEKFAKNAERYEVWVVFDDADSGQFRKQVANGKQDTATRNFGYNWTTLYDLEHLGEAERRRLAPQGQPERWTILPVKAIRHPDRVGVSVVRAFLENYQRSPGARRATGGGLDELALLYLLAITPAWYERSVGEAYLASRLSQSGQIRAEVLRAFFGEQPTLDRLRSLLRTLPQRFGQFLATRTSAGDTELRLTHPGVGQELSDQAEAYGLASAEVGHLFWALYWYDQTWNHRQGKLIEMLAGHLRRAAGPGAVRGLSERVRPQLLAAALFAIEECLRFCLLDAVAPLLRRAHEWLGEDDGDQAARLLRLAWQAYYVGAQEEILGIIIDLEDRERGPAGGEGAPDELDELFVASARLPVATPEARRTRLSVAGDDAVRACARVRALWLALSLKSFFGSFNGQLRQSVALGRRELPDLLTGAGARLDETRAQLDRISRGDAEPSRSGTAEALTVDFMALSLGAWCRALDLPWLQSRLEDGDGRPGEEFLDALETGMLLAAELPSLRATTGGVGAMDFILEGLAKELVVMVAACSLLLLRVAGATGALDGERVSYLLDWSMKALGERVQQPARRVDPLDRQVAERIELHMDLLRLTWMRLGLRDLAAFVGVRRAQFHALVQRRSDDPRIMRETEESMPAEVEATGLTGVLANAAIAESIRSAQELAATYLFRSTLLGIKGRLGSSFLTQLCLLTIGVAHAYQMDLSAFLEHLARRLPDGSADSELSRFLRRLDDDEVVAFALWIFNVVGGSNRQDLELEVTSSFQRRANDMTDPDQKEELRQRVDIFLLRSATRRGERADPLEVLERWRRRPRTDTYPYLLYLLFDGEVPDPIVEEAAEVLGAETGVGSSTSLILLATSVTDTLPEKPGRDARGRKERQAVDAALNHLRRAVPAWEEELQAEVAEEAYLTLARRDASASAYWWDKFKDAHRVVLELDRTRKLPAVIAKGRFFLLFLYYFQALVYWGLEADGEIRPPLDEDRERAMVDGWRARPDDVPEPFVRRGGRKLLSSEFLRRGWYLLGPLSDDPDFDRARQAINESARKAMNELYREILSLERLPDPIRTILDRHRAAFEEFTLPT